MELAVARHVRVLLVNEASHFRLASPVARLQQSGPQLCLHAAMTVKMAFVASQKKAPITAQRSLHDQLSDALGTPEFNLVVHVEHEVKAL